MPAVPMLKATLGEWRTVLAAARYFEEHLSTVVPQMGEEDEDLVMYDHLERLEHIIPSFERQLNEFFEREDADAARLK